MKTRPQAVPSGSLPRFAARGRRLLAPLALALLGAVAARATEDGFTPIFSSTLNGDFVTAGASTRLFGAPVAQTEPFNLTLSGIPAGSTVVAAFANWSYLTDLPGDPGEAGITINGSAVNGIVSAASPDLGWGKSSSASYTADVTSLVTGNGLFRIASATDDVGSGGLGEGFSLIAVFANGASSLKSVNVYSGFTSNTSNPPEGLVPSSGVLDFSANPYLGGPAHFFMNALDGQQGQLDSFTLNGLNAGGVLGGGSATDAWQGKLGPAAAGNLYDHAEGNVQNFLLIGQTSLTARTAFGAGVNADAVGHSFAAIAIEAVPEPGSALFGVGIAAFLAFRRRRNFRIPPTTPVSAPMNRHPDSLVSGARTRFAVRGLSLLALLALSLLGAPPARAAEDGFAPIFSGTLHGDFVTAGASTRQFGAPIAQSTPFNLTLSGIPAGSTIVAAYANWSYLTDLPGDLGESAITINGSPVNGTVSFASPDLGWGKSSSAAYTADITSLVAGNGVFAIGSATDDALSGGFGEGISIVAVYQNAASALNRINVYSGFTSNTSNPPEGLVPSSAVYNFAAGAYLGGPAHFFINALDGQVGGDTFQINGLNAGGVLAGTGSAADAWQGLLGPAASGNLYDHAEGNVASFLSLNATSLTATTALGVGAAGDAVGHSFGAIAFAAPAPAAVPEPGTALAGVVLAGFLALRRRRSGHSGS